jgi:hypothetical protein
MRPHPDVTTLLTKSSFKYLRTVIHTESLDHFTLNLQQGAFMLLSATLFGKIEISSITNHQQVESGHDSWFFLNTVKTI